MSISCSTCVEQKPFATAPLQLFLSAGAPDLFYTCSSKTPVLPGSSWNRQNLYCQKLLFVCYLITIQWTRSDDKCALLGLQWRSFYWQTPQKLLLFLTGVDIDVQAGKFPCMDLGSVLESGIPQTSTMIPALNYLVFFFFFFLKARIWAW